MRRRGGITALYAVVGRAGAGGAPVGVRGAGRPGGPGDGDRAGRRHHHHARRRPLPPRQPAPAADPAPRAGAARAGTAGPARAAGRARGRAAGGPGQVLEDDQPVEDQAKRKKKKVIATAAASQSVTISDFKFTPGSVTVNVGDTVTWSNAGPTPHSATASDGSFDTGHPREGRRRLPHLHPGRHPRVHLHAAPVHARHGGRAGVRLRRQLGLARPARTGTDTTGTASPRPATARGCRRRASTRAAWPCVGLMTLALGAYLRRRTAPVSARPPVASAGSRPG